MENGKSSVLPPLTLSPGQTRMSVLRRHSRAESLHPPRLPSLPPTLPAQPTAPAQVGQGIRDSSARGAFQAARRNGRATNSHRGLQPALSFLQSVGRERLLPP